MTDGDKRTLYDKVWDFFWIPIRWVAGVFLSHEWFPRFAPWILAARSRKVAGEDRDDELSKAEFDEVVRMNRQLRERKGKE
jgi:hypothetical protein